MTDPQQELTLIKNVIAESRKIIVDNGVGFIVWGLLISIGLFANYIALVNQYAWNVQTVWMIILLVGVAITVWGIIQERRTNKVETLAGKFLGGIWIGFIITMILNGFLGSMYPALAASMLGMAYFPTGYAMGFTVFRFLAAGWWIAAVVMFLNPGLYTVLLFAILIIVFQVLPGLIIYLKCKKGVINAVPTTI
jgi:hypothetical protein